MSASSITTRSLQARRAAAKRWHKPTAELDRDYAAERLAEYVAKVVSDAPPLTPAQQGRISALLRPATLGGDAA